MHLSLIRSVSKKEIGIEFWLTAEVMEVPESYFNGSDVLTLI